jgi:iron transport multicopper oxidase
MFDSPSRSPNVTGWLVYNNSAPKPPPKIVQTFPSFNDMDLHPLFPSEALQCYTIAKAVVDFDVSPDGIHYALINGVSYVAGAVPAIFTALTMGSEAEDPRNYGNTTNTFLLPRLLAGRNICIIINNHDDGSHPCSLLFKLC